jgi:predicted exporter
VSGELGRTVLFLVGHTQPEIARHAIRQLGELLQASWLFNDVQWDYSQQSKAFFDFYFPFRYRFISPTIRPYLDQDDGYQYLVARVKHALYQPLSPFLTKFLDDDPLLFFTELLKEFGSSMVQFKNPERVNDRYIDDNAPLDAQTVRKETERKITLEDGVLGTVYMGRHYYFAMAQLASNPFEQKTQVQLENSWQEWSQQLRQSSPGLDLTYTAAARFAASMRSHMQRDIWVISIGSTAGVVLLVLVVFRTVKHLLIALIPLIFGLWIALGFSLSIFNELHAFTLVFGTSLIGVCIDYSMHYFVYHRLTPKWKPISAMHDILPSLSLGALTTMLSYFFLGLTPLIGLQQIAVFASCGIFISLLTVIFWFPFLLTNTHPLSSHISIFYDWSGRFLSLYDRFKVYLGIFLIVAFGLSIKGIFDLRISDNPLVFKTFPTDLMTQDRFVRDMMGVFEAQQYLVINGRDAEEALQRLEKFHDYTYLSDFPSKAALGPMISAFLPSKKRQEENIRFVKNLVVYEREISRELALLGLPEPSIERFFRELKREPGTLLSPEVWLSHSVSTGLRNFWLDNAAGETSIVVRLQNVTDVQGIKDSISAFEGIHYVDQIDGLARILESYRKNITLLVIGAHVIIFALLFWRYHLKGFFVILPPSLGACITVGLLGLLGQTFHLLHCLALLLVLGMGVDYAIFLAESDAANRPKPFFAATLATVTTVLSFGLLSLSSQEALKAIGVTTFVGISCVWLLSPIAMYGHSRS